MAKYDFVANLLEEATRRTTRSREDWMAFLHTAANNYKYSFSDQMLMHVQRPDATACASLETWNQRMGCWVNRGAKGIALLDEERGKLKYVFDVKDVHPTRDGRLPNLWSVKEEQKDEIIKSLEKTYGAVDKRLSFEDRLVTIADRIATDYYSDLIYDMDLLKEGSFLEGFDEFNLGVQIRETLSDSIAYALLERCGADMEREGERFSFSHIANFNTVDVISVLGNAQKELTMPVLMEIGQSIGTIEKERKKTLANAFKADYNALKRESESELHENHNSNIGGQEHGDNISEERGLYDSEPITERGARGNSEQIRSDEKELSEGAQRGILPGTSHQRDIETASIRDSGASAGESGLNREADGSQGRSERDFEEGKSDALGTENEHDQSAGRGNRSGRDDLLLGEEEIADLQKNDEESEKFANLQNEPELTLEDVIREKTFEPQYEQMSLFPSVEKQIADITKEGAETTTASSFLSTLDTSKGSYLNPIVKPVPEAYLLQAVSRGSGFQNGKERIIAMFQDPEMSAKDRATSIRKEYGIGGAGWPHEGDGLHGYDSMHVKGFHLQWRIAGTEYEGYVPWTQVEKAIGELIDRDVYLTSKEKEAFAKSQLEAAKAELREDGPLLATDVKNIVLTDRDYISGSRERIYTFDCEIDGEADSIEYLVQMHDEGEGFTIHSINDDIWDRMSESELDTLSNILEQEALFADYQEKIDKAENEHDLKMVQYEIMEDESAYFGAIKNRVWDAYSKKEEIFASNLDIPERAEEEDSISAQKPLNDNSIDNDGLTIETPRVESVERPNETKYEASNFVITDDALGVGTAKEKFRRNIEAIQTLQSIETENRNATPEEQIILSNYVGWGGLADAFDESKLAWSSEYQELKGLLSPEEYSAARESTLNAHYTSPTIISSMYETLGRMGFEKGNILEPAMGVGNFFGRLPEEMKDSRLYGVELDSLTGRIAKQLYPKADVKITGFEKTDYPNDFFDVAIGNVPFGQYKVSDKQYDKNNFLIHDYFFAKTLDKVRPGGVVAFVTSKGTMDKKSPEVRKYLAQRAELLGAVRLPNTAFKENAGTEVTSDILFLKKRDRIMDLEPDWVHLSENEKGIAMNDYFVKHPEMIVGKMEMVSGPFGMESTCVANHEIPFAEQLRAALAHIDGEIEAVELAEMEDELAAKVLPANPDVKNFSYTLVDDKVYYRENSIMKPADVSEAMEDRIKGMIAIRNCTSELIDLQLTESGDEEIGAKQAELNELYDDFSKKNGLINSRTNRKAFGEDSSYCLLCSLEKTDEEGNFIGKADMFSKRTIKRAEVVTSVDTASEALAVSLGEKAKVDLDYMSELTGKDMEILTDELSGVIFKEPVSGIWQTADEYLSGNVRDKLAIAKGYAEGNAEYSVNVAYLERVQPKELDASEIEVRIGATWIDPKYIEGFMKDTFQTPDYLFRRDVVGVQYSDVTGQWNVKGKSADYGNVLANSTYGTSRVNAYKILEDSLNLKDTRIFDTVIEDGKEQRVLNKKETTLASQKQEAIREAFKDWVFRDPDRRADLVAKYNELFNSTRPREYDDSHLKFPGMTPDITLKEHQKNAVAHVLYGNNTLLAHCVGAGKTFEMVASAMESKRLGLCQKNLFVVPNHLTEQWAGDFLRLYPGANILAATKKDFEPANRKKFCSRIATGDYDAVIIGHSQFEKIPLSKERQVAIVERQITEIENAIADAKASKGERYTIKQMEKTRKSLKVRLDKLNDESRKDNVVTFEQLGVDRLFVDESHSYKNLFLFTKMRNVAGIAQTEAQKSSDMFAKCQYLDELTGGKGVTFATGTPISNSMTELYTNMRYLQYDTLQKLGLGHFDSWAASFGETQTAIELAPEGTGYRAKTRFAKFFNLPELISLFKEAADIQTPDMLKLPVPEAEYVDVALDPSDYQKDLVQSLADRAEAVRNRLVDPATDNMLKITNDGRKLALDQRLVNPLLPDEADSKAAVCVENAFQIWEDTKDKKSTQLIFCDLSTPKGDGTFNVYEDVRNKLIEKGVPEKEIAFIHDANTETRKAELFSKVRSGQVRFLLGSTAKMGAGTNVQDKLIALHHLDVPWRPSDIEQQEGRILRQGNENPNVKIFRYVTKGTFDSYSWQLIENKQKFIGQIMTSKSPVRSCEDIDEAALSYAEVKALATGNPYIKEKMDLDIQVSKLKLLKANHTSQRYMMEDNIAKTYPRQIAMLTERISGMEKDIEEYKIAKSELMKAASEENPEPFVMLIGDNAFTDRKEAGTALIAFCRQMKIDDSQVKVGEYMGFEMKVAFDSFNKKFVCALKGDISHPVELGGDASGNITRINHALENMPRLLEESQVKLENVRNQLETAKIEVDKPFPQEQELADKLSRLTELNALLNMDEKGEDMAAMDDEIEAKEEKVQTVCTNSEKQEVNSIAVNSDERQTETAGGENRPQGEILQTVCKNVTDSERISIKEKLAEMKGKVGADKSGVIPGKEKTNSKHEL